ncbi:MAG: aspartokinase-like uncharacterized kinase [Pirellulaceae bacterium]|jgi:aspartokinase-like uncharacterized kinase
MVADDVKVRVVKVGGSLLDWDQLPTRLNSYLARDRSIHQVLIAGGGGLVEVIRDADKRYRIGEEKSHWMCIELLSTTAKILHSIVESATWSDTLGGVMEGLEGAPRVWVVDTSRILQQEEPTCNKPLPHGWHITTDSIAARFAELLGGELVLLKSATCPQHSSYKQLAEAGYVDDFFPEIATRVRTVRFENLRP